MCLFLIHLATKTPPGANSSPRTTSILATTTRPATSPVTGSISSLETSWPQNLIYTAEKSLWSSYREFKAKNRK